MNIDDPTFTARVLPFVEGCPPQTIRRHLADACREYFTRTQAWVYELDPITTAANQAAYLLALPGATTLLAVQNCEIEGGATFTPVGGSAGRRKVRHNFSNVAAVELPNTITLHPAPVMDGHSLLLDLVLAPDDTGGADMPPTLAEHFEFIANGAVGTLALMPRVEWSDQATAAFHRARFEDRIHSVYHREVAKSARGARRHQVLF